MRRVISLGAVSLLTFLSLWWYTPLTASAEAQERVRAKVGVQVHSDTKTAAAKTTESVKTGDMVRVYVIPEEDAYVYIVHGDGKKMTLLNAQEARTKINKGVIVALPSATQFYRIDGASATEVLTIICSPQEMPEVTTLLSAAEVPPQRWLPLEKELLDKSKIDLGQKTDAPFQIAGNVRSIESDPFLQKLQIYSGKSLLVKKYELHVQK